MAKSHKKKGNKMEIITELPVEVTSAELQGRRASLVSEIAQREVELAELDLDIAKAIEFGV